MRGERLVERSPARAFHGEAGERTGVRPTQSRRNETRSGGDSAGIGTGAGGSVALTGNIELAGTATTTANEDDDESDGVAAAGPHVEQQIEPWAQERDGCSSHPSRSGQPSRES